jgi:hypothetical protein
VYYRYDADDLNCECFRYARIRAGVLYQKFKTKYNGDPCDLEQTALLAVIETASTKLHAEGIHETDLVTAVDHAILAAVRSSLRSGTSLNKSLPVPVPTADSDRFGLLAQFKEEVAHLVAPDDLDTFVKAVILHENISNNHVKAVIKKCKVLLQLGLSKNLVEQLLTEKAN